jgi:prophage antirepressor-like protein
MIEEIKEDNNCIVKAFENNPIAILQEDMDNKIIYYFKALDIGKALGIVNIRSTIQNYEDEDERVVRNVYDPYGTLQDTLFLSSQGVYRLLYNSKKEIAKKFRKWAGNILDDIIFNESAELKRQLEENKKELERTKKQLEQKTKLKVKRWYDCEPGDTIYAVKNDNSIKLGKSKLVKHRETQYVNDMFYIKKCYNCDLAEKVIHHILDKYRIENNKEYFEISEELAIYTIDIVCDFLDKFINFSEKLTQSNIRENLNNSIELIKNLSNEKNKIINTDLDVKLPQNIIIQDIIYNKNPIDFEKFINECCELGENYYVTKYDLIGCYRLWSKNEVRRDKQKIFLDYITEKYTYKDKFIPDYGSRFCVYLGIKVKPFEFIPENINQLTKFEEFFMEKCHVNYSFNIKYNTFKDTYKEWLNITYPNYIFSKNEEINIKSYFNKKFMFGKINVNGGKDGKGVVGIWGFQLKSMPLPAYLVQGRRKKQVYVIDCETTNVLYTYDSATITAEEMKINPRTLSDYLRFQRTFEYCNKKVILKYTKE